MTPAKVEDFSITSARSTAKEMWEALPKSRQSQFLGHLNELLVVLGECAMLLGFDKQRQSRKVRGEGDG